MSKELSSAELEKARADALREHNRTSVAKTDVKTGNREVHGIIPHIAAWKNAVVETTKRKFHWVVPATKPLRWALPKVGRAIGHGLTAHFNFITFKKDDEGHKHFSPKRLAFGLAADALLLLSTPLLAGGAYYYGTRQTYKDIFVPNAGVFVNQQFVHPSQPGHIIAPRDEIFTVLGQRADEKGKIESIRFDVDSNMYFFYHADAMRPDLAAAKMVPISPYGAMCDVEATGLYTRLPRFVRVNAVKWLDMRPEVVHVINCEQLQSIPPQYTQTTAPATPSHFVPLSAPASAPTTR